MSSIKLNRLSLSEELQKALPSEARAYIFHLTNLLETNSILNDRLNASLEDRRVHISILEQENRELREQRENLMERIKTEEKGIADLTNDIKQLMKEIEKIRKIISTIPNQGDSEGTK